MSVEKLVPTESLCTNELSNPERLEKRAKKLAAFSNSAATTGNTSAVFAILVLQEILELEAVDPITNLSNILLIANSIANLNTSIKAIVP